MSTAAIPAAYGWTAQTQDTPLACAQSCVDQCGPIEPTQCGWLGCTGTDPTVYRTCLDTCQSQCPGGAAQPAIPPNEGQCTGPFGLIGCTVGGGPGIPPWGSGITLPGGIGGSLGIPLLLLGALFLFAFVLGSRV